MVVYTYCVRDYVVVLVNRVCYVVLSLCCSIHCVMSKIAYFFMYLLYHSVC